jgi:hypothetical protein
VIRDKALLQGFLIVIRSLDQRFAAHIIRHLLLGRVEDLVICPARSGVDETASDSSYEQTVFDLELHCMFELLGLHAEHFVEFLRLRNCSGETIEDEAVDSKC